MKRLIVLTLAALGLSGCATVQRVDAAADVHAFLIAIRDGDKATFDAHVDRPALTRQLESRLISEVRDSKLDSNARLVGTVLAGPLAKLATDTLVRPSVFRMTAVALGYSPDKPIPRSLVIASALRPIGDGRVCAAKSKTDPCLLTFAYDGATWRLTSFDGDMSQLIR